MVLNPDPDAALMLRVKSGDLGAFEQLVGKYQQAVINLISRTIFDSTEAEDIAQNVFLQAYKSAERYEASAKFSTWLFTIARNLCLNELRRRSRHPADSLEAGQGDEEEQQHGPQWVDKKSPPSTESILCEELAEKVREALSDLPENQRTAILLFREQDMAYEDIARVMGTTLSATKSLIHRGRETLKARLKPYLKTGFWTPVNDGETKK